MTCKLFPCVTEDQTFPLWLQLGSDIILTPTHHWLHHKSQAREERRREQGRERKALEILISPPDLNLLYALFMFRYAGARLCVYPAMQAVTVGAVSSEVDVGVLADLVQRLGLAGNAFQIHHWNMTTLDQHLSHTHKRHDKLNI